MSDKKTGKGIYINIVNNEKYEGQYLDNEKHGLGTFFYKYGDKYSGEWVNGNKHGNGTFTFQNGTLIEGKWQDDKLNGPGRITYNNDDFFEGISRCMSLFYNHFFHLNSLHYLIF